MDEFFTIHYNMAGMLRYHVVTSGRHLSCYADTTLAASRRQVLHRQTRRRLVCVEGWSLVALAGGQVGRHKYYLREQIYIYI